MTGDGVTAAKCVVSGYDPVIGCVNAPSHKFLQFKFLISPAVAYRVPMLLESFHYPQAGKAE
jgi:hypothetical protein